MGIWAASILFAAVPWLPPYSTAWVVPKHRQHSPDRKAREPKKGDSPSLFEELFVQVCGGSCPRNIELDIFGGIRGVAASRPFKAGENVVRIPISSCWKAQQQKESEGTALLAATVIKNLRTDIDPIYQQLLPTAEELREILPVRWPVESVEELPLHFLGFVRQLEQARADRERKVREVKDTILDCTLEEANTALDLVQTRSCRVLRSDVLVPIMAPVFDMVNHGPENAVNTYYLVEDDYLVIRACAPIETGSQIFLDYGSSTRPVYQCLLNYGFVPESVSEDDTAVVYSDGQRFEVTRSTVPYFLVEHLSNELLNDVSFSPAIAMEIAQLALQEAKKLETISSESAVVAKLRESQRKVLLALQSRIESYNCSLWRAWKGSVRKLRGDDVVFCVE